MSQKLQVTTLQVTTDTSVMFHVMHADQVTDGNIVYVVNDTDI